MEERIKNSEARPHTIPDPNATEYPTSATPPNNDNDSTHSKNNFVQKFILKTIPTPSSTVVKETPPPELEPTALSYNPIPD
jgi:hypothetical protein